MKLLVYGEKRQKPKLICLQYATTGRPLYVFVFKKKIYEGYEESSENCTFKSRLGRNIAIKLNETLVDSCMVFLGPSKASYSEITFGRWRLRQEKETRLAT